MEFEDAPRRANNLLAALATEDLDRLSQDELMQRIVALEAEIVRVRARHDRADRDRANADALFR